MPQIIQFFKNFEFQIPNRRPLFRAPHSTYGAIIHELQGSEERSTRFYSLAPTRYVYAYIHRYITRREDSREQQKKAVKVITLSGRAATRLFSVHRGQFAKLMLIERIIISPPTRCRPLRIMYTPRESSGGKTSRWYISCTFPVKWRGLELRFWYLCKARRSRAFFASSALLESSDTRCHVVRKISFLVRFEAFCSGYCRRWDAKFLYILSFLRQLVIRIFSIKKVCYTLEKNK